VSAKEWAKIRGGEEGGEHFICIVDDFIRGETTGN
jgi:hypothetical protein